jgi:hypothetical protein
MSSTHSVTEDPFSTPPPASRGEIPHSLSLIILCVHALISDETLSICAVHHRLWLLKNYVQITHMMIS